MRPLVGSMLAQGGRLVAENRNSSPSGSLAVGRKSKVSPTRAYSSPAPTMVGAWLRTAGEEAGAAGDAAEVEADSDPPPPQPCNATVANGKSTLTSPFARRNILSESSGSSPQGVRTF